MGVMTVGTHLLAHVSGVPRDVLEFECAVSPLLDRIAVECDLHVMKRAWHQFEPEGVTGVLVLSESHMPVHTYPERGEAYLDVFCCSPEFDAHEAVASIKRAFEGEVAYQVIVR